MRIAYEGTIIRVNELVMNHLEGVSLLESEPFNISISQNLMLSYVPGG